MCCVVLVMEELIVNFLGHSAHIVIFLCCFWFCRVMFVCFVDGHLTVHVPQSAWSASSKCIKMVNTVTHVPIAKVNCKYMCFTEPNSYLWLDSDIIIESLNKWWNWLFMVLQECARCAGNKCWTPRCISKAMYKQLCKWSHFSLSPFDVNFV